MLLSYCLYAAAGHWDLIGLVSGVGYVVERTLVLDIVVENVFLDGLKARDGGSFMLVVNVSLRDEGGLDNQHQAEVGDESNHMEYITIRSSSNKPCQYIISKIALTVYQLNGLFLKLVSLAKKRRGGMNFLCSIILNEGVNKEDPLSARGWSQLLPVGDRVEIQDPAGLWYQSLLRFLQIP